MSTATAERAMFSIVDISTANNKSPHGLSERQQKMRKNVNFRPITLKDILAHIDRQDLDEEIRLVLRKRVSRYPHAALQHFADHFEQMVNAAHKDLRKSYAVNLPEAERPKQPKHEKTLPKTVEKPAPIKAKKIDIHQVEQSSPPPGPEVKSDEAPVIPPLEAVIQAAEKPEVKTPEVKKPKPEPAKKSGMSPQALQSRLAELAKMEFE